MPSRQQQLLASLLIFIFSESCLAAGTESGNGYSPFDSANCLINGMAQFCFEGGISGPVQKIFYPDEKRPDHIKVFDRSGRIVENHVRLKDFYGGWNRFTHKYSTDGLRESSLLNGKDLYGYTYTNRVIANLASFDSPRSPSCQYSFLDVGQDKKSLRESCGNKESIAVFNSKHQLLKLYGSSVASKYIRTGYSGPIECSYEAKDRSSISRCTDGHYEHLIESDTTGRKIRYERIEPNRRDRMVLEFSYTNDREGNWTSRTMKYLEVAPPLKSLPNDVVDKRSIEYFR